MSDASVRYMIRTLVDVEVSTDDLEELRKFPEKYVSSKADIDTIKMLFDFIDLTKEIRKKNESGK